MKRSVRYPIYYIFFSNEEGELEEDAEEEKKEGRKIGRWETEEVETRESLRDRSVLLERSVLQKKGNNFYILFSLLLHDGISKMNC